MNSRRRMGLSNAKEHTLSIAVLGVVQGRALQQNRTTHVSDGSWLRENAGTINPDGRTYSRKVFSAAQLGRKRTLRTKLKNILALIAESFDGLPVRSPG